VASPPTSLHGLILTCSPPVVRHGAVYRVTVIPVSAMCGPAPLQLGQHLPPAFRSGYPTWYAIGQEPGFTDLAAACAAHLHQPGGLRALAARLPRTPFCRKEPRRLTMPIFQGDWDAQNGLKPQTARNTARPGTMPGLGMPYAGIATQPTTTARLPNMEHGNTSAQNYLFSADALNEEDGIRAI